MCIENELQERSGNQCELCSASDNLNIYEVPPTASKGAEGNILVCATCMDQIENPDNMEANHWHCLNDSMWSEIDAVKVIAWRMLTRLGSQDMLDMMYLEDDVRAWAEATGEGDDKSEKVIHKDSNGITLSAGDSVVLIKDLPVKGSSMIAKRGTAVRRISLDHENSEYIEGKVEGQQIVIITKYVKKI
ncbi:MAG: PhnA protein [Flavobacteriales bacterium]|nr:MAG: PhnA protein [Flavobacteriales bacterium]